MAWQTRATTILEKITEDLQDNHALTQSELVRQRQARKKRVTCFQEDLIGQR